MLLLTADKETEARGGWGGPHDAERPTVGSIRGRRKCHCGATGSFWDAGLSPSRTEWPRNSTQAVGLGGPGGLGWRWGEEGGVEVKAGRGVCSRSGGGGGRERRSLPFCLQPELQGGGWGSAEGRCQQPQLEHGPPPKHTGPRTDSDLPQNQPSVASLTSWPGHSITARPPRRTRWPAWPGSRAGGGGGGRSQLWLGGLAAPFRVSVCSLKWA